MITLYQQTDEIFDIAGNSVGFETQAVLLPDTFFLDPELVYDWDANTVSKDSKVYYLDKLSTNQDLSIPSVNEWLSTYGNDIKQVFYNGLTEEFADNPSGNSENIKRRVYLSNNIAKYILEYKYDSQDRCTKISSIAPKGAVAIIDGGDDDETEEIIDETEQNLFDLKVIPLVDVVVGDNNKVAIKKDSENCVFISRNGRRSALYSDAIKLNPETGNVQISYTANNWNLKAVAYSLSGDYIATFNATNKAISIDNNYNTAIGYIALIFSHTSGNLPSTMSQISQRNLGLSVVFKEYCTVNMYNYDAQGNTNVEQYYKNENVILPTLTQSGYEFLGWYSSANEDDNTPITSFVATSNINIYARWRKIVNVYIHDVDGNGLVDTSVLYSGDEITIEYIDNKITRDNTEYENKEYYLDEEKTQLATLPIVLDMQSQDIDIWVKYTESNSNND